MASLLVSTSTGFGPYQCYQLQASIVTRIGGTQHFKDDLIGLRDSQLRTFRRDLLQVQSSQSKHQLPCKTMLIFELGCTVLLPYDGIYFQSQRLKQDLIGGSWEPYPIFFGILGALSEQTDLFFASGSARGSISWDPGHFESSVVMICAFRNVFACHTTHHFNS